MHAVLVKKNPVDFKFTAESNQVNFTCSNFANVNEFSWLIEVNTCKTYQSYFLFKKTQPSHSLKM